RLVEGDSESLQVDQAEAIPGGLAIKLFPACYALQRPIGAVRQAIGETVQAEAVTAIRVRTPESTVAPLLHHRPKTGFEGKFSLEYSLATALIDDHQGFEAFDDPAVQRAEAQRLIQLVETELLPGGNGLLDGQVEVAIDLIDGRTVTGTLAHPPGSPA